MEKKQYLTPEMEVINIALQKQILDASLSVNSDSNDYGEAINSNWED